MNLILQRIFLVDARWLVAKAQVTRSGSTVTFDKEDGLVSTVKIEILDGGNRFQMDAQSNDIGRMHQGDRPSFPLELSRTAEQWVPDRKMFDYVTFTVKVGVLLMGAVAMDHSGDDWIVYGFLPYRDDSYPETVRPELEELYALFPKKGPRGFAGCYNTRTRKGFICPMGENAWISIP